MAGGDQQPPADQGQGTWAYRPEEPDTSGHTADHSAPTAPADPNAVEWTASEFIAHDKSPLWYLALAGVTVLAAALVYVISRDMVPVVVISILAVVIGVAAARKPRIITYRLDKGGVTMGSRFYPYGNFKSFAIVEEGVFSSITLLPLKRFNLPISIYFSPDDEARIMDIISRRLPLQPGELDSIDRFMRNIHF